ncbi:hypothetical protein RGR602_PB00468 (plasmid) [Rhizobium gallicum bv. gallicum R602sp]|uniref:Uncharacterized protein n=1 Tax=Rhizobium gallicum bv. gallicum R602sp TaxID=1041138 RepID=A0A0B4XBV5_9HYPH|nr:hypothetical protein RGR602_PB00468 [Rhizobium gallicum bv. gallicum R602sp]
MQPHLTATGCEVDRFSDEPRRGFSSGLDFENCGDLLWSIDSKHPMCADPSIVDNVPEQDRVEKLQLIACKALLPPHRVCLM